MQIVLLVAGVVSLYPLKELETGIVLIPLTLFNAVLGLRQEGKAAAAVAALQQMMIVKARVMRDGELAEVPAEQLVPGDVVAIEAGDLVPADGRLLRVATLEVAESALTGESLPVAKGADPVGGADTPLGDRTDMVYMNTNVTRGSGEFVVTAIGMATEVGKISGLLPHRTRRQSPLTRQLATADPADPVDRRGRPGGVDGAEPGPRCRVHRGLRGGHRVRHRRAAGEPAGGGHHDPGVRHAGAGQGRRDHETDAVHRDPRLDLGDQLGQDRDADPEPDDRRTAGGGGPSLHDRGHGLLDAPARSPGVAGRVGRSRWTISCCRWCWPPTPSSTTASSSATRPRVRSLRLAAKGGVDAVATRQAYPRIAELPFDADYKLMATFHRMTDGAGREVVRCFVKGAPDQLLARAATVFDADTGGSRVDDGRHPDAIWPRTNASASRDCASSPPARKDFDPATFDPTGDLLPLIERIGAARLGRDRGPAPPGGEGIHRHRESPPASGSG